MNKSKRLLIIIIFLVVFSLSVGLLLPKSSSKPLTNAALKLDLDQGTEYKISLKKLSVEEGYFSDYKLQIPFGFYNVKIVDKGDRILFSGKVEKNRVTFPPYEIGTEETAVKTEMTGIQPLTEINLRLPYYPNADRVIFSDEKSREVLSVEISGVKLPENFSQKLCGNGICDSNENLIFCYGDCRPR